METQSIQSNQTNKTITTTKTEQHYKLEISDKTDFVLLDLRDEVSFEKYRIIDGMSILI